MSRVTDAELASLDDIAHLRLSEEDRAAGYVLDDGMAIMVRDQSAKQHFARLVTEIRERRAADLSTYDIDILKWLRGMLADESFEPSLWESSIAVLDRLLSHAGGDK